MLNYQRVILSTGRPVQWQDAGRWSVDWSTGPGLTAVMAATKIRVASACCTLPEKGGSES